MVNPLLGQDIGHGGGTLCATYASACGHAIGAANMCASLVGSTLNGVRFDETAVVAALDCLDETQGEVINRHLVA